MSTAKMRMVKMPKKRMVWTIMALPLVVKLPNSTMRAFPGSWKSSPGERRMKRSNPNRTGAQSNIESPAPVGEGGGGGGSVVVVWGSIYRGPVGIWVGFNLHRRGCVKLTNFGCDFWH
ncbi:hypothetical protein SDJN03_20088, partial [Cucurbita argyrosperma subsp. sororia]